MRSRSRMRISRLRLWLRLSHSGPASLSDLGEREGLRHSSGTEWTITVTRGQRTVRRVSTLTESSLRGCHSPAGPGERPSNWSTLSSTPPQITRVTTRITRQTLTAAASWAARPQPTSVTPWPRTASPAKWTAGLGQSQVSVQ